MSEAIKELQRGLGITEDGDRGPVTTAAILAAADAGRLRVVLPVNPPVDDLPWMKIAKGYLGQREIKGDADNAKIVELFALAGFSGIRDDETAWCAAFVGGVLKQAGIAPSGSLGARSYEAWGNALTDPVYGCVGVKKRAGGGGWEGHVGFVVGANSSEIIMLGGNQGDAVSVAAFSRRDFTAFRYPSGFVVQPRPLPTSVAGAARAVTEA